MDPRYLPSFQQFVSSRSMPSEGGASPSYTSGSLNRNNATPSELTPEQRVAMGMSPYPITASMPYPQSGFSMPSELQPLVPSSRTMPGSGGSVSPSAPYEATLQKQYSGPSPCPPGQYYMTDGTCR